MKKLENYLLSLLKKYNVWTIALFSLLLVLVFHINEVTISIRDFDFSLNTYQYMLLFSPVLVFSLGLCNIKNKVNVVDLLITPMMFGYLYLAIYLNDIYYYIVSGLLLIVYIVRGITYRYDVSDIEPNIKQFMSKLNYHFPIVVIFVIAFILPFLLHYLNVMFECSHIIESVIYIVCNVLAYIYLVFSLIVGRKRITVVDYVYFLMIPFLVSNIMFDGFVSSFQALVIPLVCFIIRADTYNGNNEFKKRKYFSELFKDHSIVLAMIAGALISFVLYYTNENNLFGLSQNLFIFLFAFLFILLLGIIIIFGNLRSHEIAKCDYWLTIEFNLTYYAVIYFIMGLLKINQEDFLTKFKDDLFISVGAIVITLCFIVNLSLYCIRYMSYTKNNKNNKIIEPVNDIVEEITETVSEEPINNEEIVEQPIMEEDLITEEVTEEPVIEEVIQEQVMEEVVVTEEVVEEPVSEEIIESTIVEEEIIENVQKIGDLSKLKFEGKLMYSTSEVKEQYSIIKNLLMSYSGVSSRISNNKETFRKSGVLAQLKFSSDKLVIYLAITPLPFIQEGYKVKDVSDSSLYADTPLCLKIDSDKSLEEFKLILDVMMKDKEIKPKQRFKEINYVEQLYPNGESILLSLGLNSDYLVSSVNSRIINKDLPDNLGDYAARIDGEELNEDVYKTTIYLDVLCNYFKDGDVVNKAELISKKLIKKDDYVVIKGRGTLDKKLIIIADDFDDSAIKMLMCTNGTVVYIKH